MVAYSRPKWTESYREIKEQWEWKETSYRAGLLRGTPRDLIPIKYWGWLLYTEEGLQKISRTSSKTRAVSCWVYCHVLWQPTKHRHDMCSAFWTALLPILLRSRTCDLWKEQGMRANTYFFFLLACLTPNTGNCLWGSWWCLHVARPLRKGKSGGYWSLLLTRCMLVHHATRYFLQLEGQGRVILLSYWILRGQLVCRVKLLFF